ncbi:MAG: hypothetical protein KDK70_16440 [Myxococcales bacterium]|nr:hypothetical protein [Myxococcales bacterium]
MLHPVLRHAVFVHRFVEAVTWQPLRQALRTRPRSSLILPREPREPGRERLSRAA